MPVKALRLVDTEERISLRYGLIGQETNGLGGFANACWTVPIALEIAADMERLCPDDCAVEVSSLITASGPQPLNVASFPEDTLRLLQLMKSFERLTIEVAITGNRHTAWRALVLNPLIVSGENLEQALDEVIEHNRKLMSTFHPQ
ncbi:putative 6-phospho-beta-glucosidase [Klebsiella huaxiensis]|uniref:Putative 6-phospho-beta-glucosidase n=1 Tax=Klebsiella huaxiensis TaxID=2153354 RepID=A0A564MGB3_9ENTR|nr:hypothetical protein [Klebsiella huaxiensis]VUS92702.1 putative 6-phospho-beta-glucosidase [Klebsiella huaxiensis]